LKACTQCGRCCLLYADGGLSATEQEIAAWQAHQPDIARYVQGGEIWMDPESGERLTACPFLLSTTEPSAAGAAGKRRYSCAIYDHRPADCRYYPVNIAEMQRDGCEMLELRDLDQPRAAQRKLDEMMADSRPPLFG
jgi:Fe-S-cluster containining protein